MTIAAERMHLSLITTSLCVGIQQQIKLRWANELMRNKRPSICCWKVAYQGSLLVPCISGGSDSMPPLIRGHKFGEINHSFPQI